MKKLINITKKENSGEAKVKDIAALMDEIKSDIEKGCSVEEYQKGRVELNTLLIETLVGGEVKVDKKSGDPKLDLHHKMVNSKQLARICYLLEDFVSNVESPFLVANCGGNTTDDMNIAVVNTVTVGMGNVTYKALKSLIANNNGLVNSTLTAADAVSIYSMAKEARQHHRRVELVVVGGVSLLVVGGVALYLNNKKKDKDKEECSCDDDVDVDDIDDIDVVDADDEDLDISDEDIEALA